MPSILKRRQLSPEKLRQARLKAGFTNISDVARRIGMRRLGYKRWEEGPGLTHFDYFAFDNMCQLFKVSYADVTDELEDRPEIGDLPQPARSLPAAPA